VEELAIEVVEIDEIREGESTIFDIAKVPVMRNIAAAVLRNFAEYRPLLGTFLTERT
jgi:hypothetical protein